MFQQGDIILVNFPLPKGFKLHPAIVISVSEVYESEESYICAMISSVQINDNFSFLLNNEMLSNNLDKQSQVRCQLIALLHEDEIERKISKLKKEYVAKLLAQIKSTVLDLE
jgi:mRNA-degrading endonuclease toxin of MazEF toxin-antitoxin module